VFFPVGPKEHAFHGCSRYTLAATPEGLRIARKKVELMNDYIPSMLDVYCV
jgi:3-phenylpropionate/cinnamic acid dioxygenase small subunit